MSKKQALKKNVHHLKQLSKSNRGHLDELLTKQQTGELLPLEKRNELILEHRGLGQRLAWKMLNRWRIRIPNDEVTSVVGAALCEAALRFDPSRKVSFKTFFFYHLRGMLIKEIIRIVDSQKLCQIAPEGSLQGDSFEIVPDFQWHGGLVEMLHPERLLERKETSRWCWSACLQLDTLEREVIVRSYIYDQPLVDIASELGYCRCHISRVKSRALARLERIFSNRDVDHEEEPLVATAGRSATELRAKIKTDSYKGGRGRRKTNAEQQAKRVFIDTALRKAVA